MKPGIQSQGSETTQKDREGRLVRGGFGMGEHIYTHGWFMLMCGKNHPNTVK